MTAAEHLTAENERLRGQNKIMHVALARIAGEPKEQSYPTDVRGYAKDTLRRAFAARAAGSES